MKPTNLSYRSFTRHSSAIKQYICPLCIPASKIRETLLTSVSTVSQAWEHVAITVTKLIKSFTVKGYSPKGVQICVTAFQWSKAHFCTITLVDLIGLRSSLRHLVRMRHNLYQPEFQTYKFSADCLQTTCRVESRLHTVKDRIFFHVSTRWLKFRDGRKTILSP